MDKTVELVNKWAAFQEKHPGSSIEDFCRYSLTSSHQKQELPGEFLGGVIPPHPQIILIKLIGRISKLHMVYINSVLERIGIRTFDEFLFLNAVNHLQHPKKTEVIYHNMTELSTGLNIINGLKELGFLDEYDDPTDKRSKRLKLTAKGSKTLKNCYSHFGKVSEMFFSGMAEEDVLLCIQLLKNVEIRFSNLWQQHKGKSFEEIFAEITGGKLRL